jgi:hypothetical protein
MMKKLTARARGTKAAVAVAAAALGFVLVRQPLYWAAYALMIAAAGSTALCLHLAARKKLMAAQLVMENAILHIAPAVLHGRDEKAAANPCETVGMYVSVFGILLGNEIIAWGQDGDRRLQAVEIGRDCLSIDYGTLEQSQNIRLLYTRPDSDSLAAIVENFRYETGVVPVVKD